MFVHRTPPWALPENALTDEREYHSRRLHRRAFLVGAAGLCAAAGGCTRQNEVERLNRGTPGEHLPLSEPWADLDRPGYPAARNHAYALDRPLTPEPAALSHNNFYEFGTQTSAVWRNVAEFLPRPWQVTVTGAVERPMVLDLDDIERLGLEERTYRFRCVEAWAMAVPWTGVPLRKLVERCRPLGKARFVRFVSFHRPSQAPGQRSRKFPWPYYEGLKLKEAVHELALLATGIYGHALPRQNGAPVRLVVPWKYGFKNIKSIARIEFVETLPSTFWNDLVPREYTFDGLVNPQVPHPRWSQAKEKLLGSGAVRATQWLNGYADLLGDLHPRQPRVDGWHQAPLPFKT